MAQGDGDGICRVIGLGHGLQMQNSLGHVLHLVLGGVTIAHQGLFDLGGIVGSDFQSGLTNGKQDHTAALGYADTGGDILAEKQLFDGHRIGFCYLQQFTHIFVNDFQSGGKIHARGSGDRTALEKTALPLVGLDKAEAGDSVTGVNSQNFHRKPPLAICQ